MFDRKPAALELHTFPECAGQTRSLATDIGFSSIEAWLLQRFRRSIGDLPIRLILGKHEEVAPPSGTEAIATVSISDRRTLAKLLFSPEIAFGDGYADGRIVVDGDLVQLMEHVIRLMPYDQARTMVAQSVVAMAAASSSQHHRRIRKKHSPPL